MQMYPPPVKSNNRFNTDNVVASSVIHLHPNTSSLEVSSFGGQGIVIRWIPRSEDATVSPFRSVISSGAGANFDHHIPSGEVRQFVVPKETQGTGFGQKGSVNGLYQRIAWINAGITASSILAVEY